MNLIKILIVDDEEELVSTLAERLSLRGFHVEIATSGTQALDLARQRDFDVVIADVKMPGIDGLDLMATMKRDDPKINWVEEPQLGLAGKMYLPLVTEGMSTTFRHMKKSLTGGHVTVSYPDEEPSIGDALI